MSVIDGARCNGTVTRAAAMRPRSSRSGRIPGAGSRSIRPPTPCTCRATAQDVLSVVDTAHCRAGDTSGCDREWPTLQTGGAPFAIGIDERTRTLYTANFADNALGVLDASACSALRDQRLPPRRRRRSMPAPAAANHGDQSQGPHRSTRPAGNQHELALLDSERCTPKRCVRRVEPVPGVSGPSNIAVDEGTQTIYVLNQDDNSIALLDAATCNISRSGGCAPVGAPVSVPGHPVQLEVDPRSHAVYVTAVEAGLLYRIDGAHCRIGDRSRCTPRSGPVGEAPVGSRADPATGTVYVTNESRHRLGGRRPPLLRGEGDGHGRPPTAGRRVRSGHAHALRRELRGGRAGKRLRRRHARVQRPDHLGLRADAEDARHGARPDRGVGRSRTATPCTRPTPCTPPSRRSTGARAMRCARTGAAARRAPRAAGYFPRDVLLDGAALYVTSSFDRTFQILPTG